MAKAQKTSVAEKAANVSGKYLRQNAIITGSFLLIASVLTWWLTNSNVSTGEKIQGIKEGKVDSGSINTFNAKGDIKIENNTFNGNVRDKDSIKAKDSFIKHLEVPVVTPITKQKTDIHEQTNVTSNNQSGGQNLGSTGVF